MRPFWPLLVVLLLASLAPVAAQDEARGTIHVTVCIEYSHLEGSHERSSPRDVCWGDTVEYADVTAEAADGTIYTAQADFHGVAIFPDVPVGTYTLRSDATGFDIQEKAAEVQAGARNVTLLRAAAMQVDVAGHLVDEAFQPITDAWLAFDGPTAYWNVTTDGEGRFEAQVPSGYHFLEDGPAAYRIGWTPVFIDGTGLDLMLLSREGQRVTGQVVDQHGDPVPGANIDGWSESDGWGGWYDDEPEVREGYTVVSPGWDDGGFRATADADGRFEFIAAPGWAEVSAWADGYREGWTDLEIEEGIDAHVEIVLHKLPDKTAHVTGTIVDATTGEPVDDYSIDLRNVAFGEWACSTPAEAPDDEYHWYPRGCDLTTRSGSFEGDVMPGYSILEVWADRCYDRCRDLYIPYVESVVLEPGENTFTIELQRRPAVNSAISGYILDEDGEPVDDAWISFSNEESYGWGDAEVDAYGSYRVKLHDGWHRVSVWAPGHYPWEGMVQAIEGQEVPLDVRLVAGEERCCGGFPGMRVPFDPFFEDFEDFGEFDEPVLFGEDVVFDTDAGMGAGGGAAGGDGSDGAAEEPDDDADFVDLGGLGQQYDASNRDIQPLEGERLNDWSGLGASSESDDRAFVDIPGWPVTLLLVALLVIARRR